MNSLSFYMPYAWSAESGLIAQAARDMDESGYGGWVLLGLVVFLGLFAFRTLSKANMRRLQGGSQGPETDSERSKKREDRKQRRLEAAAEAEAKKEAPAKAKTQKKKGPKKAVKKTPKGTKKQVDASTKAAATKGEVAPGPDLLLPAGVSLQEGLQRTRQALSGDWVNYSLERRWMNLFG